MTPPTPRTSPKPLLTPLQRQRVRVIEAFVFGRIADGYPSPTVREIAAYLGLSVSAAQASITHTLAAGRLVHDADTPRSLRPGVTLHFSADAMSLVNAELTDREFRALATSPRRARQLVAARVQLNGQQGWDAVVDALRTATIDVARELALDQRAA